MSYCKVIISGRMGNDPEIKYLQSGTAVANFNVAVSKKWRDKTSKEMLEKTTWYKCTAWGATAELCSNYLKKGREVLIEADEVESEAWTTDGGEVRSNVKITVRQVVFIGSGNSNSGGGNTGGNTFGDDTRTVDEIPF